MSIDLAEIRSFVTLASELHFRKASERLFLSQPALSKQIRKLEEKLGGRLFTRTRRKVALTEAGAVLLPKARRLIQETESLVTITRSALEGRAGTLRVGFGIASVSEILPPTILRFRRDYPDIELHMRDMSTPSQVAALLDDRLDAGILRLPIAHPELMSIPLFRERLVLAVPTPSARPSKESLTSYRNKPFIFLPGSASETFHHHALELCRRAGFTPHVVQEASEVFTILNLVRANLGVSLVPSAAMRMNVPGVRFVELRMKEAEWQIGIAWMRSTEKSLLIGRLVDMIRSVARSGRRER